MQVPHTTCLEGTGKSELETHFWFFKRALVLHLVLMKDGKQTLHASTRAHKTTSSVFLSHLATVYAKTD
jgi:hypothetical protein